MVVFCAWPLSSFLILHNQPDFFLKLELLKLTVLSSAIAAPFLLLNSIFCFFLVHPNNPDLVTDLDQENILAASSLFGAGITTLVLSTGAIMSLFDAKYTWVIGIMLVLELGFLLLAGVSIFKETPSKIYN